MAHSASNESELKICDVCLDNRIAKWWCVDCQQYLCDSCLKCHCRSKKTKSDVLPVDKSRDVKETAIIIVCEFHPKQEVVFQCITCKHLVCWKCLYHGHINHMFLTIEEFIHNTPEGMELMKVLNMMDNKRTDKMNKENKSPESLNELKVPKCSKCNKNLLTTLTLDDRIEDKAETAESLFEERLQIKVKAQSVLDKIEDSMNYGDATQLNDTINEAKDILGEIEEHEKKEKTCAATTGGAKS